ncbi:TIGR00297 family protein [Chroococcidiopsis sp. CCNUC1]|nr:TIGR00297 family protein [Chroococcidiopsis sp. CCNUC1]URD52306.1 TIGR00297 family protein [Chroococcidiopsis sp. CCNUC1]
MTNNLSLMLSSSSFLNSVLVAVGVHTVLLGIAWIAPKKLLTPAGLLHALFLGVLLYLSVGWQGELVVVFYFLVGSAVTYIGMAQKEAEGIAEKRSGARGPENVWSSALTGALCAVGIAINSLSFANATTFVAHSSPIVSLLLLGFVASFSTKLSDTCATEVGKAYGQRTFLITTLQPVARGTEGAVSLEGTLAGVAGSVAIATLAWGLGLIDLRGILWCVIAAFIATNIESLIGATVEGKVSWLTHDVVNFLNTLIGAIAAILLALIWQLLIVNG